MKHLLQLQFGVFEQNKHTHHFNAATGGPGATTHAHENQKKCVGKRWPQKIIGSPEPRGGYDGNNLEQGQPESLAPVGVILQRNQNGHDQSSAHQDDDPEKLEFLIF